MKHQSLVLSIFFMFVFLSSQAVAQDDDAKSVFRQVRWLEGPGKGSIGDVAEINVPSGYVFADASDTKRLMEAMQNPTNGTELGLFAPSRFDWFMVFAFRNTGYIRDDEKNNLDADAMLKSIKENNDESNKERTRKGWATINLIGWVQQPRYNETTHNLEWAVKGESNGSPVVNWNTRILGRKGVMTVNLITDPSTLESILPQYNQILANYSYNQGNRYEEFRQGDKISEYGLTALVVGGATAAAVKTGAAKWLWKLIVVAVGGAGVFFKNLFSRKKK